MKKQEKHKLDDNQQALLELVQIGLTGNCLFSEVLYRANWKEFIKLASLQGVASICLRGLEVLHKHDFNLCPTEEKLQLYARQQMAEKHSRKQLADASAFAEGMKPLKCVVLKGIDYAHYWDKAEWREFGDLDSWMVGDGMTHQESFDKSNQLATAIGAKVEDCNYKHNHIHYNGLTIENHLTLTSFEGRKDGKALEHYLQERLAEGELKQIGETNLYSPSADFTALFMLVHAHRHFMAEGIELKHVIDWYYFMKKEGSKLDWAKTNEVLCRFRLKCFADVMTAFCVKHFGLNAVSCHYQGHGDRYLEAFAQDMFSERDSNFNRNVFVIAKRVARRFRRLWEFRDLNTISFARAVWMTISYSSIWGRKPELD